MNKYFALGTVLAVVARGVDGRFRCEKQNDAYLVSDKAKCWAGTMNKRFGKGEKLMETCTSNGWVSCCSVGLDKRCARAFGRACLCALVFRPPRCIPQT